MGDTGVSGAVYKADVYEYPSGVAIAHTYQGGQRPNSDYAWLKLPLVMVSGKKFTRGKQYEFRFTRPGDSVNFYYDETDPYGHGLCSPPPESCQVPLFLDLCMRVYGKARVGHEYAVQSVMPWVQDILEPVGSPAVWRAAVESQKDIGISAAKIGYACWPLLCPDSTGPQPPSDWPHSTSKCNKAGGSL